MKTIVLIESCAGGHRKAFMCLFAQACLQNGAKVICLYPEVDEIKEWILIHAKEYINNVTFINYRLSFKTFKNFGRFNNAFSVLNYWKSCAKFLQNIEKENSVKIDLVYFNWIDSQMANYLPASILDLVFTYKWSGLYFHPSIFRTQPKFLDKNVSFKDIDSIFTSKNCVAVTLHDEGISKKYQNRTEKKVILFPEIADDTLPNPTHPFPKLVKEKAQNRTIIGIIGLEPYKGALSLIRLTAIANPEKFFFAFTGVYNKEYILNLSENEQQEYLNFIGNLPENCLWQTGVLQEGEDYNSVFNSFDIIHIIYKNFYSSSNRLTKAAIFNKLVLANNNGCVGDDVPIYNLGETADENNIDEQLQKMEILRKRILTGNLPYEQWKIYAEKHSTERLKEKFEELLNLV